MPHISSVLFKVFCNCVSYHGGFSHPGVISTTSSSTPSKISSSFATLFSFLILLIGRKNLGRWHFSDPDGFCSLFRRFQLPGDRPARSGVYGSSGNCVWHHFVVQLLSFAPRCRSKSAWSSCCWRLRRFSASCGICSITLFFRLSSSWKCSCLCWVPTVVFRFAADRKSSGKLTEDVHFITAALVIGHAGLSNWA